MTHSMRWALYWLGRMTLASGSDLSGIGQYSLSQINRALEALRGLGLAIHVTLGHTRKPTRLWFLTTQGVNMRFATDHRHPDAPRRRRYGRGREEAPRNGPGHLWDLPDHLHGIREDPADHEHPPWWVTEAGLKRQLNRLPVVEQINARAPTLLRSGDVDVSMAADGQQADGMITDFFWIGDNPGLEAVARYGEDFWVPFTWSGIHLSGQAFKRRWAKRYDHLDHDLGPRVVDSWEYRNSDLPNYTPQPSGIGAAAADWWADMLAGAVFLSEDPSEDPYLSWSPNSEDFTSGRFRWSQDLVADPFRQPKVGNPEAIIGWVRKHPALQALNGVLATRVFTIVEQRQAMRVRDLVRECRGESSTKIKSALEGLVHAGLVFEIDGHYYLDEAGDTWAGRRDRVLVPTVRRPHQKYRGGTGWWHKRDRQHNEGVNEIGSRCTRAGLRFAAGWRLVVDFPGNTQLDPDGLIGMTTQQFGKKVYLLEFERSAKDPQGALEKQLPYRKAHQAGLRFPVVFVLENTDMKALYQRLGADLPLITSNLADIRRGPITGRQTCWRFRGEPIDVF